MTWAMLHYKERFEGYLNSDENKPESLRAFEFDIVDPGTKGSGDAVKLIAKREKHYFQGIFQQYSACCAFEQMNHFAYSGLNEKEVAEILNYYIRIMQRYYRVGFAKKLVINTVQEAPYDYERDGRVFARDHGFIDLKECGVGAHAYPHIYNWATGFTHVDTPVINHNTCNIIHHIITFP